ncbi:Transcriptional activator DEMETER [Linum grandiflorum]
MLWQESKGLSPTTLSCPVKESLDSLRGSDPAKSVPVTPNQPKKLQTHQLFASASHSSQGHDGEEFLVTSMENEVSQQNENVADVSSRIVPESLEVPAISGRKQNLGINLNRTPVEKSEKRKKHRPKVIVDQNSKRKPFEINIYVGNSATNPTENPTGRRTYIRVKGQKEAVKQDGDFSKQTAMTRTNSSKEMLMGKRKAIEEETTTELAAQVGDSLNEKGDHTPMKFCRRALNLDGRPGDEMTHYSMAEDRRAGSSRTIFDLNASPARSEEPALGKASETQMLTEAVEFKAEAPICEIKHCTPEESDQKLFQAERRLVPYKGSGAVVPHEGVGHPKKRAPGPKVDLDPETERKWKLLMGNEESTGMEVSEYLKEQRKIFRERSDSFIARMHLIQGHSFYTSSYGRVYSLYIVFSGDRRFSKWKGSVVDSVIGVFLTPQNVADHLSR